MREDVLNERLPLRGPVHVSGLARLHIRSSVALVPRRSVGIDVVRLRLSRLLLSLLLLRQVVWIHLLRLLGQRLQVRQLLLDQAAELDLERVAVVLSEAELDLDQLVEAVVDALRQLVDLTTVIGKLRRVLLLIHARQPRACHLTRTHAAASAASSLLVVRRAACVHRLAARMIVRWGSLVVGVGVLLLLLRRSAAPEEARAAFLLAVVLRRRHGSRRVLPSCLLLLMVALDLLVLRLVLRVLPVLRVAVRTAVLPAASHGAVMLLVRKLVVRVAASAVHLFCSLLVLN